MAPECSQSQSKMFPRFFKFANKKERKAGYVAPAGVMAFGSGFLTLPFWLRCCYYGMEWGREVGVEAQRETRRVRTCYISLFALTCHNLPR